MNKLRRYRTLRNHPREEQGVGALKILQEASQVSEQVDKFCGRTHRHFGGLRKGERTEKILWGDFVKFCGPLDLTEVQGGYSVSVEEVRAQEGQSRRSESEGPSDLHVISCIGDSRVEAPCCCNKNCDITIHDILTRSKPSIVWDTCPEIPGSWGLEHRRFQRQETLAS
jgi:hypothetical protein